MYQIDINYQHRKTVKHFDDTENKEQWQREVYLSAREYCLENKVTEVHDVGCGGAYKLDKYFPAYSFQRIGYEIEPTLSKIKGKYKELELLESNADNLSSIEDSFILCADVIEHIERPDEFLSLFKSGNKILISTPDRDKLRNKLGPPVNTCHYREWSTAEFIEFTNGWLVNSYHMHFGNNGQMVLGEFK